MREMMSFAIRYATKVTSRLQRKSVFEKIKKDFI
jgi:hypothetical protein